ncbi:MAG: hypothetical protein ACYDCC_01770 [Actinomycetota bacterium]
MKKAVLILLVIATSLTACASKANLAGSSNASGSSKSNGASGPNGTNVLAGGSVANGSAGATASAGSHGQGSGSASYPSSGPTLTDSVAAGVSKYNTGCAFQPGEQCSVPLNGYYYLISDETGRLVFAEYEDDSKIPAAKQSAPVTKGYAPFQAKLNITIGSNAHKVTFHVWLEASNGVVLAKGGYQTFTVVR